MVVAVFERLKRGGDAIARGNCILMDNVPIALKPETLSDFEWKAFCEFVTRRPFPSNSPIVMPIGFSSTALVVHEQANPRPVIGMVNPRRRSGR